MVGVSKVGRRDNATNLQFRMNQHPGRREREARKRRLRNRRGTVTVMDRYGVITLKLGRKKSMDQCHGSMNTDQLKKKFRGCVVDAER